VHLRDGHVLLSPSDVTAYLACEHLTALSLRVARHEIPRPAVENEQAELLFRKGREHESAHLQSLIDQGQQVTTIEIGPAHDPGRAADWERAARETVEAMRAGVDVVYQGVLVTGGWRGQADFLMRVDTSSGLGAWSYEALDTKLARQAKPAHILQLCFYSELLARAQGLEPAHIHVLLGNRQLRTFAPHDFGAYYRRVCRRLEKFVADPPATEPFPCGHCGICSFRTVCDEHWDAVDHLCRVADMRRHQIEKLNGSGIATLAALGVAAAEQRPPGMAGDTFGKLREQAALQLEARTSGEDDYVLLQPQAASGFALLPDPSPGDLYFDFEGNPFWDIDGSLEYLWGITDAGDEFTALWAASRGEEQAAFERFIDLVRERLDAHPDLHVYHYARYEITALRRMMGRYGTREAELDDLLRRGVFVDLFKVVRSGLRVSRPGYGLKEMEHLLGFERAAEIKDGGTSIVEFERWMVDRDQAILDGIAAYNREDCIATRVLRDWLLERRAEALELFGAFPLPQPAEPIPTTPENAERAALRLALLATGDETSALAAQLLDHHDREREPVWWALFDKVEMTHRDGRTPELERGPNCAGVPPPDVLPAGKPYGTDGREDALERIGRSLLAADSRYPAIESVLRRDPFDRDIQTNEIGEMTKLLLSLDGGHLVIQGPPGSGKTGTSGRLIARLIAAGKRVGVASTSHGASHRLLAEVEQDAAELGVVSRGTKPAGRGDPESEFPEAEHPESEHPKSERRESEYPGAAGVDNVFASDDRHESEVICGTARLFSDGRHDGRFDYLFIDEAGQVSLADALAMGTAARNLVLVGDPQQLGLQGSHPEGGDSSVLEHLLGGKATISSDRGLFLEQTFRLHPGSCGFISEEFYEGRLQPDPVTSTRTTPLGTGLRWIPVEHTGCRQDSAEEVEAVRAEIAALTGAGVEPAAIKVMAPYNAQVDRLRSALPGDVEVGTVDRFQGQEAQVVFYSMASSSGADVPRGLDFLLSRNRFNVAISRAQCLAYLVCSPRLLEVDCRTIDHMRLANALCRFVEVAGTR